jgi:UDP-glucose 4-epimerase
MWLAGAATVASSERDALDEASSYRGFLDQLRRRMNLHAGTVVLASSAGGVYAGAHDSVISIDTPTSTISAYGRLKVEQEETTRPLANEGATVRIVRITNLFGPRSNARKAQGIVHHLARAVLTREPISIYVPLSTARDYVYVDDAAEILSALAYTDNGGARVSTDILGSGRAVTLAELIALVEGIAHRRVPYALATGNSDQPGDLRFTPSILADRTSLESGIRRTLDQLAHVPR